MYGKNGEGLGGMLCGMNCEWGGMLCGMNGEGLGGVMCGKGGLCDGLSEDGKCEMSCTVLLVVSVSCFGFECCRGFLPKVAPPPVFQSPCGLGLNMVSLVLYCGLKDEKSAEGMTGMCSLAPSFLTMMVGPGW